MEPARGGKWGEGVALVTCGGFSKGPVSDAKGRVLIEL